MYRDKVKEGRRLAADDSAEVFSQKEAFGDVLVAVDGSMWAVDQIILEVLENGKPRALTKDTKLFFFFDVCRLVSHNKIY